MSRRVIVLKIWSRCSKLNALLFNFLTYHSAVLPQILYNGACGRNGTYESSLSLPAGECHLTSAWHPSIAYGPGYGSSIKCQWRLDMSHGLINAQDHTMPKQQKQKTRRCCSMAPWRSCIRTSCHDKVGPVHRQLKISHDVHVGSFLPCGGSLIINDHPQL